MEKALHDGVVPFKRKYMWINEIKIDSSWNDFLTNDIKLELENIEKLVGKDYTPASNLALRFMQLNLKDIKVVILGQDPYKPEGVANGRAFQPTDLVSWNQTYRQVSLKNIVRALYKCYNNIDNYKEIPKYSSIADEIYRGTFKIKEPIEWFDSLENQGVLFLNTSLTCRIGESNSHEKLWRNLSDKLLKYIAETNKEIIWFLWGKSAIERMSNIKTNNAKVYESNHPMMCSEKYADDFLKSKCFKETSSIINWLG